MALEPGTKLGHYEVVSSLGAGGMGELYRARVTSGFRFARRECPMKSNGNVDDTPLQVYLAARFRVWFSYPVVLGQEAVEVGKRTGRRHSPKRKSRAQGTAKWEISDEN